MKIEIVNGSPRKGNTVAAISAFVNGLKGHEVEIIDADKANISPCKGCGACECYKGCVAQDDSNVLIDKLVAADMIVFASPVYWWGVTAQIKTVIDKCYCKGAHLKGKKIGLIIVGGASTDNVQYDLIGKQFECIAQYLNWDIVFYNKYSASAADALAADADAMRSLEELAAQIAG